MKIAVIGRGELMYNSAEQLINKGHEVKLILTARGAPEYLKQSGDFERLAKECGAHFIYTSKIGQHSVQQAIKSLGEIDLAVSVNYSGIIPSEVIGLFPLGILNAHGGDLPKYRGNACQAWALLHGESKIGLCVHQMIGGELDSGNIVAREYLSVDIDTRIGDVYNWMNVRIPVLFEQAISKLEVDKNFVLEVQSKNNKDAMRCYPRRPEDGKIKWDVNSDEIVRLINVSSEPFSGAYCNLEKENCIIWRARVFRDDEIFIGVPGQVASLLPSGEVVVLAKVGKVLVQELEIDKKRVKPTSVITSSRMRFL